MLIAGASIYMRQVLLFVLFLLCQFTTIAFVAVIPEEGGSDVPVSGRVPIRRSCMRP
jgi:hypothetical protein